MGCEMPEDFAKTKIWAKSKRDRDFRNDQHKEAAFLAFVIGVVSVLLLLAGSQYPDAAGLERTEPIASFVH